ncbi:putative NAD-dependent epimerase/dehydratase [Cupriavidus taiwanensis]|uniref:NAD-dependent epimerase/dehydratase n=1 Tax=Cupriavidus taiwanensis TaxID=164546 RepID=A0A375E1G6_9BURK|nr:D-erythronate dehydrogenase [Cupriavidus taiwanensis]SOZ51088.1 putative NAD-dependent epimerase/dehydratase [Cupriavidus taiwanensis]SOZ52926.1 putative NAD-dependent epimerase/dehydratase [Cupriavidus taiwanensis]SOZ55813.1 putative NAD-dependent epimerase/dehydratase [Cupriavidus taiwanensis]SPA04438.1 putative NAD-dependent epimerase/dehydratase [Cupriavidus taiwanensis]SPA15146.1 putative NAD-dependent epimerase/dehydratase [Cupriavidus taiwanensis]
MNVLITGGAGFLGLQLARLLLQRGTLNLDGQAVAFERLTLLDVVAPQGLDQGLDNGRVRVVTGDLSDAAVLRQAIDRDTGAVFHLAAVVSGQAEADFDLGMRVNLDASRALLETCRELGHKPRVLFTSSVAVYGGELPPVVQDDTALNPQSSYGVQKAIGELLLSDYSRRGFVDGRVLRLPTISVRPGKPNAAASSFASGIIREPLAGVAANCPVAPETKLWLLSPRAAVAALVNGIELSGERLGNRRVVNLPGLSVTAAGMVDALRRVAGDAVADLVTWEREERVEKIVGTWPAAWNAERARALGFESDASFDAVIRAYMEDAGVGK